MRDNAKHSSSRIELTSHILLVTEDRYLRKPAFSVRAWRSAAAAFGELTALVAIHRDEIDCPNPSLAAPVSVSCRAPPAQDHRAWSASALVDFNPIRLARLGLVRASAIT